MLIRPATPDDISTILKIESLFIPNPYTQKQFLEEFNNKNSHFFVVINKNKVIAYLLCHLILDEMELIKIVVDLNFHRQGIGTKLFNGVLKLHPKIRKVFLEVRDSNSQAIQFYKKQGFDIVGRRKQYYSNQEDAILMTLNVFPVS